VDVNLCGGQQISAAAAGLPTRMKLLTYKNLTHDVEIETKCTAITNDIGNMNLTITDHSK
jgi:hypothetical protein